MAVYVKTNGTEIDVHESSVSYALSLGWKKKEKKAAKKVKKENAE